MTDEPIDVTTNGTNYADVRVDGYVASSVDVVNDKTIRVTVCDPQEPEDAAATFTFERP